MITLTIFGKDGSKQVVNQSKAVLTDNKNQKLHPQKLANKMREAAQTIAGQNYFNHKFSM